MHIPLTWNITETMLWCVTCFYEIQFIKGLNNGPNLFENNEKCNCVHLIKDTKVPPNAQVSLTVDTWPLGIQYIMKQAYTTHTKYTK